MLEELQKKLEKTLSLSFSHHLLSKLTKRLVEGYPLCLMPRCPITSTISYWDKGGHLIERHLINC